MKKPNKSRRLRKQKKRKNRKSNYPESVRIAVEQQRARIDEVRTAEFQRKLLK